MKIFAMAIISFYNFESPTWQGIQCINCWEKITLVEVVFFFHTFALSKREQLKINSTVIIIEQFMLKVSPSKRKFFRPASYAMEILMTKAWENIHSHKCRNRYLIKFFKNALKLDH